MLDNLLKLSPVVDDADISNSPLPPYATPTDMPIPMDCIHFISQNVMKSNVVTHSLLSVGSDPTIGSTSSYNPPPPADIILVQEPWHDPIGIDTKTGQRHHGLPSLSDWIGVLPVFDKDNKPDVSTYVPKRRDGWSFQPRSDLLAHPSIQTTEIYNNTGTHIFVVNVYNPSDSSSLVPLMDLLDHLSHLKVVVSGDFNLHHPAWSLTRHEHKTDETAHLFADRMTSKGYHLANRKDVPTYFKKDYSSTLDLLWTSSSLTPHLRDYRVAPDLHVGSDHYPSTWSLTFAKDEPTQHGHLSHNEDDVDNWIKAYVRALDSSWTFPDYLSNVEELRLAVDTLMDAMETASRETCLRKPHPKRPARWYDKELKKHLRTMRKDRRRAQANPTKHNILQQTMSAKTYKFQLRKAKRNHAMKFASQVTETSDLWKLNSWYKGVRARFFKSKFSPYSTNSTTPISSSNFSLDHHSRS